MGILKKKNCPQNLYTGKFRDAFPLIQPAGLLLSPGEDSVVNTFKWYTTEDKVNALKHTVNIYDEKKSPPEKLATLKINNRTYGCNSQISELIRPPDTTIYQHLLQDLKESVYDSWWNKKIGLRRDPTSLTPKGIDLMNLPYRKSEKSPLKDIIFPNVHYSIVEDKGKIGHENYIKSHNDYYPGEQIKRKYECPFTKNSTFGVQSNTDPHGKLVAKCLKWSNQKQLCVLDEKQAKYRREYIPEIGKAIQTNSNTNPDYKIKPSIKVGDLLRECEPNTKYKNFLENLAHINKVRRIIKNQVPSINFKIFYTTLINNDKGKTGWLSKELVYNICNQFKISFNRYYVEPLMEKMEILKCDLYEIKRFVNVFNPKIQFPAIPQLDTIPHDVQYYESIYRSSYIDQKEISENDVSKLPTAGFVPLLRDKTPPYVDIYHAESCHAYYEDLGTESTVKTLLNPSLQTLYGLTNRDYLQYRPKDQLKAIFQKVTNMSNEHFEFLWNQAVKIDNGQVNVQMLRDLLEKFAKI